LKLRVWMVMAGAAIPAMAQGTAPQASAPDAQIVYHYERPGLPVPTYTFTLHEDGRGSYKASYVPPPASNSVVAPAPVATEVNTHITLTPATTAKLFEEIRGTDHFRKQCESKAKNVADTGWKTIEYTGPDGRATCTYNYTENKALVAVTEIFGGIATMMDMGRQLEFDRRYDRLGLDAKMTALVAAIKDKSALEVQTIAATLRSIAEDPQVIERVRVQAGRLIQTP